MITQITLLPWSHPGVLTSTPSNLQDLEFRVQDQVIPKNPAFVEGLLGSVHKRMESKVSTPHVSV